MYKNFFVIVIIGSFCCLLYGIFNVFLEVEENACRMTYMFGAPKFSRVRFDANAKFPHYALYYYYEGIADKDVNTLGLHGAPVIFVPGNGGSHKQVRSLASVALRKGADNGDNAYMDYFTISYNEELSGLYGGYLENQKLFLKICIETVVGLYKSPPDREKTVVLIGHSMGGKVAQAVLADASAVKLVNTNVFVSTPLDTPVMAFDAEIANFYRENYHYLSRNRLAFSANNDLNVCSSLCQTYQDDYVSRNLTSALENILFISIGGGNRDVLVRPGLTTSQFSDIHAMTSSIPYVWLSCDHLSSVWCLQLMLVINRFLFSITYKDKGNNVLFKESKLVRMKSAVSYFVRPTNRIKTNEREFLKIDSDIWYEDSKKVFQKHLKSAGRKTYNQMISLSKFDKHKKLYLEIINFDEDDWLYGCQAKFIGGKNICERGTSLSQFIHLVPAREHLRSIVLLDIHKIKNMYSNWSHIVVRLPPKNRPLTFNTDIHDPNERNVAVKAPRWFVLNTFHLFNETAQGTLYYKLRIEGLEEPFQSIKLNIKAIACIGESFDVTIKICVPWAPGYTRYHKLTENSQSHSAYVNVPIAPPSGYNSSLNPVTVEIFLDPRCRFSISYQSSVANIMSRTVQEYHHWFPSHLIAVLLIVLKNQLSKFNKQNTHKKSQPYTEYFQFSSIFLLTGCRIFKKLLIPLKFMPKVELATSSFFVSIIVHSTAISISILSAFVIWFILIFNGNVFYKVISKFTNVAFDPSSVIASVLSAAPSTFGALTIAIALGSCSGVALICACGFYLLMISNAYKDYLENLFWETTKSFLRPSNTNEELDQSENTTTSTERERPILEKNSKSKKIENTECNGLENFGFHITMFFLLFILAVINGPSSLAWLKNTGNAQRLPDSSMVATIIVLVSLTVLLQLKAPNKLPGYKVLLLILYACASVCIVYCQEAFYRVNWIIAFVYAVLAVHELVNALWKRCRR